MSCYLRVKQLDIARAQQVCEYHLDRRTSVFMNSFHKIDVVAGFISGARMALHIADILHRWHECYIGA